jgi:hypothetical protein
MKWAEVYGITSPDSSAERFVAGALRRIRVRSKVKKLMWMEGFIERPRRAVARELEELWPSQD